MNGDIRHWLALNSIKGIGSATSRRLLNNFNSIADIFSADESELSKRGGVSKKLAHSIAAFREWDSIEKDIEKARKSAIKILCWEDSEYPRNLLNIYDPPPVIYMTGDLRESDKRAVAIVGARNASLYGREMAENFSYTLAAAGVTIVSGMARGIDTAAHSSALKAGGRTIAVMGCGVDVVYPSENRRLFSEIAENGAVISEFPPGTAPEPGNFPRRNRIISGLSLGVMVVEAALKSGSLITARYALEQGREVYAIPGNINSLKSRGTNCLIKEGAKLVERPDDILEDILPQQGQALPCEDKEPAGGLSLNKSEERVFKSLGAEPLHIDELAKKCMMEMSEISTTLLSLELMGAVKQYPGKIFTRRSEVF